MNPQMPVQCFNPLAKIRCFQRHRASLFICLLLVFATDRSKRNWFRTFLKLVFTPFYGLSYFILNVTWKCRWHYPGVLMSNVRVIPQHQDVFGVSGKYGRLWKDLFSSRASKKQSTSSSIYGPKTLLDHFFFLWSQKSLFSSSRGLSASVFLDTAT